VTVADNAKHMLHITLNELLTQKSQRDHKKFTSSQLANALQVKRSLIQRLLHPDPSKRVTNPRVDTLQKIVDFFVADGFNITIDGLLGLGEKAKTIIDVQSQMLQPAARIRTLELHSLSSSQTQVLGQINLKIESVSAQVMAYIAQEDLPPIFKKGSLFIVDPHATIEHETLVAILNTVNNTVSIKKYLRINNEIVLKSLDSKEPDIMLTAQNVAIRIIGVVIQVNAKT
jgi:transcriptional regulator with XRE-family HTH domain